MIGVPVVFDEFLDDDESAAFRCS
ncbi:MAG: hypothetical protein JWP02_3568, partial [Acidimicrobiales bacterium]|nr:hypothetical protein [Acidimicrobiales bacterium]